MFYFSSHVCNYVYNKFTYDLPRFKMNHVVQLMAWGSVVKNAMSQRPHTQTEDLSYWLKIN